jgi:hypothetical protein
VAKIPVGDTINYAYTYTFGNLLPILGLTWLPLAITAAIGYYAQTLWFDWLAKVPMFTAAGRPDPQAMMNIFADMGAFGGLLFLVTLVALFLTAVVAVAVTTHSLGMRSGQTYIHLAAGAPEWRVFGGYIRLFFSMLGIIFIATLASLVVGFTAASVFGGEGGIGGLAAAVVIIAIICLAVLTLVRMSFLMVPSIVVEPGKGGLARSYHLTRGNFWRIIVIVLVLYLPVAMVAGAVQSAVIGNSFMGPLLEVLQQAKDGPMTPEQWQSMFTRMMEAMRDAFLPMAIINFVSSIFLSGLIYGGSAYAYRALTGAADATAAPAPATA